MNFTEFLDLYGTDLDCKRVATTMSFDPEVVSFNEFVKKYHQAVNLGLTPDNAAEVFIKKFKVECDFNLDAKAEGLTVSEWACKEDPFSYWYLPYWADVADGKLTTKTVFSTIAANKDEVTKSRMSKNYNPSTNVYVTDSGVTISSDCRITKADLEKYKMPYLAEEPGDEGEVF